jgi:CheY-like chemotaxis protein
MKIICHNCQTGLKIPDHKIASGEPVEFGCPKCKTRLNLDPAQNGSQNVRNGHNGDGFFDFVEEEGQTALVCEPNPLMRKTIIDSLVSLGYRITSAESVRDALKRMRYHSYGLVVVNENFDSDNPESNGILLYLERLSMTERRNMFVALISDRFRTMDNMMALNKSANLVINTKNIDDIDKILSRGIKDNEFFYHAFMQALVEAGRT